MGEVPQSGGEGLFLKSFDDACANTQRKSTVIGALSL